MSNQNFENFKQNVSTSILGNIVNPNSGNLNDNLFYHSESLNQSFCTGNNNVDFQGQIEIEKVVSDKFDTCEWTTKDIALSFRQYEGIINKLIEANNELKVNLTSFQAGIDERLKNSFGMVDNRITAIEDKCFKFYANFEEAMGRCDEEFKTCVRTRIPGEKPTGAVGKKSIMTSSSTIPIGTNILNNSRSINKDQQSNPTLPRSKLHNLFNHEKSQVTVQLKGREVPEGAGTYKVVPEEVPDKKIVELIEELNYEINEENMCKLYVCKVNANKWVFEEFTKDYDDFAIGSHKVIFRKGQTNQEEIVYEKVSSVPDFDMNKYVNEIFVSTRKSVTRNVEVFDLEDMIHVVSYNADQIIFTTLENKKHIRNEVRWFYTLGKKGYNLCTTVNNNGNNNNNSQRSRNYNNNDNNRGIVGNRNNGRNNDRKSGNEGSGYKGNNFVPWSIRKNWQSNKNNNNNYNNNNNNNRN